MEMDEEKNKETSSPTTLPKTLSEENVATGEECTTSTQGGESGERVQVAVDAEAIVITDQPEQSNQEAPDRQEWKDTIIHAPTRSSADHQTARTHNMSLTIDCTISTTGPTDSTPSWQHAESSITEDAASNAREPIHAKLRVHSINLQTIDLNGFLQLLVHQLLKPFTHEQVASLEKELRTGQLLREYENEVAQRQQKLEQLANHRHHSPERAPQTIADGEETNNANEEEEEEDEDLLQTFMIIASVPTTTEDHFEAEIVSHGPSIFLPTPPIELDGATMADHAATITRCENTGYVSNDDDENEVTNVTGDDDTISGGEEEMQ